MLSLVQEASALLITEGSITMCLSRLRYFPKHLVWAAGWGFGFAQGELTPPQAVQPSALWPVHAEGILLPGCGVSPAWPVLGTG